MESGVSRFALTAGPPSPEEPCSPLPRNRGNISRRRDQADAIIVAVRDLDIALRIDPQAAGTSQTW